MIRRHEGWIVILPISGMLLKTPSEFKVLSDLITSSLRSWKKISDAAFPLSL